MTARIAFLLLLLALGACVTVPAPQPLPQLSAVPAAFEMTGRLSIRQGDRSDIARLRWTHRGDADTWVIASPLGNEVARLEATRRGAVLTQAGGPTEQAADFQALSERLLGVALDPAELAAALHGKPPAAAPAGWTFTVDETQQAGAITLAKRITASRDGTVVRLVVDSYQPVVD